MPNWTNNTLVFVLPTKQKNDFLAAIKGPDDWLFPTAAFNSFEQPKVDVSNHVKIQISTIDQSGSKVIRDFKTYMSNFGWPDWMKPSIPDLEIFLVDKQKLEPEIVPFSVAKLSAWKSPEEFAQYFPDATPEKTTWEPSKNNKSIRSPIIDFRTSKIGVKWSPSSINMEVEDCGDKTKVIITYTTPWAPISDISELLKNVCITYNAKFALLWVEEQSFCGYTYFDPADDSSLIEQDYDIENPWNEEIEEEDGFSYHQFNFESFQDQILDSIGDPDFS